MFKKIITTIFTSFFLLIVALVLLFIFVYRTEINYASPVWSKDGDKIYYVKKVTYSKLKLSPLELLIWDTFKTKSYIMSMRPDSSGKRVIFKFIRHIDKSPHTLSSIGNLAILPDNQHFIFIIWADEEDSGIYKVNTNGKNLLKLINLGTLTKPTELFISPDGTKIAYTKERYRSEDWSYSLFSSWVIDIDGKNNHMVCGEESHVIGWTKDGKLVISALTDLEGNVKPEYEKGERISYDENVRFRILVYDFLSKRFDVKTSHSFDEFDEALKNLGVTKKDPSISPDGKKCIFYIGSRDIGVKEIDEKNESKGTKR